MNLRLNLKYILYISFILLMLPSFCFIIGEQFIPTYIPITLIFFISLLIFFNKELINKLIYYYNKTPFKYLILFVFWSFITIFISLIRGNFFLGGFINSTIGGLLCSIIIPCIIVIFVISKYINVNRLFNSIYFFSWLILLLGLIEFFVFTFNIPILEEAVSIFSNKRLLIYNSTEITRVISGGIPRIRSIFDEPAYLGYFIFIMSPIIYEWTSSYTIKFKSKFFNKFIKSTIIPLMWINLILTQSPIFLIFNIIFSSFYLLIVKKGYKKLIKHFVPILILLILISIFVLFLIKQIDFSKTYLNRIFLVLQNLRSFDNFIMVEPSLGTRIIIIINAIQMGIQNIATGIGYGNMAYMIGAKLTTSNLPLTEELVTFIKLGKTGPASTIFIKTFSETGLLGIILLYYFIYELYKKLSYIKIYSTFDKHIINGLCLFLLVYAFATIYDSNLHQPYVFIIIGSILYLIFQKDRKWMYQ